MSSLDKAVDLELLLKGQEPEPEWSVHDGSALYVLVDTRFHQRYYPAIRWVGETDHMKRSVR